jgi:hypothetical protein
MLIPDEGDKKQVTEYLEEMKTTFEAKRKSHPEWLWKRVRRYIPEKDTLYKIMKEFFDCWGPIVCTITKQPLFSEESWKKSRGILHDIQKGWVSDPQGVSLYVYGQGKKWFE